VKKYGLGFTSIKLLAYHRFICTKNSKRERSKKNSRANKEEKRNFMMGEEGKEI